jgi:hypothetical protein
VTRTLGATSEHVVDIADDALPLLDDAMIACIDRLVAWAAQHAAEYGVEFRQARVHRWQSIEDPDWVQVVTELTLRGPTEDVFRFWEAASNLLGESAEAISEAATDLLALRVHWL